MTYGDDVWRAVAELSGLLLSEENQETTLRRVAELAVRSIHGCDAVGVTIFREGEPVTNAATGGLVHEVDNYQYVIGSGPCLQTITDHEVIEIQDMRDENRFGQFAEHAVARGIFASLSFPLLVRGEALGALNLYATTADAFGPDDRQTGQMFARAMAVMDRIITACRAPITVDDLSIPISLSLGVAVSTPGTTAAHIIKQADQEMMAAKRRDRSERRARTGPESENGRRIASAPIWADSWLGDATVQTVDVDELRVTYTLGMNSPQSPRPQTPEATGDDQ